MRRIAPPGVLLLLLDACVQSPDDSAEASASSVDTTGGVDASGNGGDPSSGTNGNGDDSSTGASPMSETSHGTTESGESTATGDPSPAAPCDFEGLQEVATVLATADDACVSWLESVYGRVARSGPASAVIWSTNTAATTAVLLGARHSLGMGWSAGDAVDALLVDPNLGEGVIDVQVPQADAAPQQAVAPRFMIRVPELPSTESNSLSEIRPRHDYYVAALDDQLFTEFKPFPFADALHHAPPTIFDPFGAASSATDHAEASAGDAVIVLGHPSGSTGMAGCLGTVLSDDEAIAAIAALADAGDEEGAIAYDPEAEIVIAAEAVAGMSGGGVFDVEGRIVGVAVRATLEAAPARYVRAVRASFIDAATADAVAQAPGALADAVRDHLPAR
jgi:Trypsin-like peptidase domain